MVYIATTALTMEYLMKPLVPFFYIFTAALGLAPTLASAEAKVALTGEQVYQQACFACHATGVMGAPKPGDKTAWAPLIEEGQATLTAHAWVGVRAMPAQGGATNLSLEEFAGAVAWMASTAGGDWKAPDAKLTSQIRHEAAERLEEEIEAKKALIKKLESNN